MRRTFGQAGLEEVNPDLFNWNGPDVAVVKEKATGYQFKAIMLDRDVYFIQDDVRYIAEKGQYIVLEDGRYSIWDIPPWDADFLPDMYRQNSREEYVSYSHVRFMRMPRV
jgi:hypothetical protein